MLSWAFIWIGFCSHRNSLRLQRDFFLMQLREIQTLLTQKEGLLETCLATDFVTKYKSIVSLDFNTFIPGLVVKFVKL